MKCISKRIAVCILMAAVIVSAAGCGSADLVKEYHSAENKNLWKSQDSSVRFKGLSDGLCVSNVDVLPQGRGESAGAAGLFDLSGQTVLYGYHIHEKMYPASITKIMTALLVLENYQGDYTDTVTVTENAAIKESGAQVCGYKAGDVVTIDQLLHALLIYSGNDAAMILAEYIGGSVDNFVQMMNQRSVQLGATNTHFVNPHGLHDDEHYTTVYDLYLMFNKVMQYDKFREIINQTEYTGEYLTASQTTKKVNWKSTNQFLSGDKQLPEGVVMIGGKTGTTSSAGACLILLSQNAAGSNYISVAMQDPDKDTLYTDMTFLLSQIPSGVQ